MPVSLLAVYRILVSFSFLYGIDFFAIGLLVFMELRYKYSFISLALSHKHTRDGSYHLDPVSLCICHWESSTNKLPKDKLGFIHFCNNPTSWLLPSGYFAFGFYQEGQRLAIGIWLLDGTPNKTPVWAANRNNPISANATLVLAEDNILALTSEEGEFRFVTGQLNKHIYSASMLDNGNFVLYSSDSQIIWQSLDSPTNTILAGQSLRHAFIELYSTLSRTNHTSGRFKLDLYEDRLLLSPVDTPDGDFSYYWELLSPKKDFHKLNLDENGHM